MVCVRVTIFTYVTLLLRVSEKHVKLLAPNVISVFLTSSQKPECVTTRLTKGYDIIH